MAIDDSSVNNVILLLASVIRYTSCLRLQSTRSCRFTSYLVSTDLVHYNEFCQELSLYTDEFVPKGS